MWWRQETSPEVQAALAAVRIFSALPSKDLEKLASGCVPKHFGAGEAILEEGSIGLGMFIVTAGRIEVFKTHGGRKIALAERGGGAVLGEMALLDDQPRSASAVALEDTDCLLLTRDRFRTLVKRRPKIAWQIVMPLARTVRELNEQLLGAGSRRPAPRDTDDTEAAARKGSADADPAERDSAAMDPVESPPDWPAPDLASAEFTGEGESEFTRDGSGTDVLRAPYALAMTGAVGFGESVRVLEVFLRSLDETCGLAGGRPMSDVLRELPGGLTTAGKSSWERSRRLPSKMLDTFRDHLRSDWREEDPE